MFLHSLFRPFTAAKVKRLHDLGYSRSDCERALQVNSGRFPESAAWLTAHATRESAGASTSLVTKKYSLLRDSFNFPDDKAVDKVSSGSGGAISGVEVRAEAVCICVIDDCLDADVPLVEMTFHGS